LPTRIARVLATELPYAGAGGVMTSKRVFGFILMLIAATRVGACAADASPSITGTAVDAQGLALPA